MARTFVERVAARHVDGWEAKRGPREGDAVWLRPTRLMTHDNSSAVLARFLAMGARRVVQPDRGATRAALSQLRSRVVLSPSGAPNGTTYDPGSW